MLKLLTTQPSSQERSRPWPPNRFTGQLVQFTGVEQAINTKVMLENLLGLVRTMRLRSA